MEKVKRVRTGCWTCRKRHRKCDETKPSCLNCVKSGRSCEGYEIRLSFDVSMKSTMNSGARRTKRVRKAQKDKNKVIPPNSEVSPLKGEAMLANNANTEYADIPSYNLTKNEYSAPVSNSNSNSNDNSTKATTHHAIKYHNDNFQQLSFDLFEDLDNLFNNVSNDNDFAMSSDIHNKQNNDRFADTPSMHSITSNGIEALGFGVLDKEDSSIQLTYEEENMMLKHFFQNLLPLLDAHPNSPWPDLALKYCDFDIARSCFISLACIHLYESKRNEEMHKRNNKHESPNEEANISYSFTTLQEYYKKGMANISIAMSSLVNFINSEPIEGIDSPPLLKKKKQASAFVVLILINVHVLFTVLEEGKSGSVRYFFQMFSKICQDKDFFRSLVEENEKKKSLVVVLSWYDTVTAIVSPDCRLPYCSSEWYCLRNETNETTYEMGTSSTAKMMGCPGEIFRAMARVCRIRHLFHLGAPFPTYNEEYEHTKRMILNYRDYVLFDDRDYNDRLKCTQCWAIAVYITLERTKDPMSSTISKLVSEFIEVYGSMDAKSPLITQMVWPVYAVGCECKTAFERSMVSKFMDTLYNNVQMGTLFSLRHIVQQVWALGITQEEFLLQWLPNDVDYLPV